MAPEQIGRYRIRRELGRGGFATVYLGEDRGLDDLVAIKVLAELHSGDPDSVERFVAEARVMRNLRTPGVVTVFDVGEHEGSPYFVMEYCERGTLDDRLRSLARPLTVEEGYGLAQAIARAMGAMHGADPPVVHRDIKPGNLLIRHTPNTEQPAVGELLAADEELIVGDFGLAKVVEADSTKRSQIAYTRGFAPPEQIRGEGSIDTSADVFAASAVVVSALSGEAPAQLFDPTDVAFSEQALAATGHLRPALERGMRFDRTERHDTIRTWSSALSTTTDPTPGAALKADQPGKDNTRSWAKMALAGLAVVVTVAGVGVRLNRVLSNDDASPTTVDLAATVTAINRADIQRAVAPTNIAAAPTPSTDTATTPTAVPSTDTATTDTATAPTAVLTVGPTLTPAPTAAPAPALSTSTVVIAAGDPIRIASWNPTTGSSGFFGTAFGRAVDLAIEDYGPIAGFAVDAAEPFDTACDIDAARTSARALLDSGEVVGVIGPTCGVVAEQAVDDLVAAGIPIVAPWVSAPTITSNLAGEPGPSARDGLFRFVANDALFGVAAAEYARSVVGAETAAVIDVDAVYTDAIGDAFVAEFVRRGGTVVARSRAVDVPSITTATATMNQAEPGVVFIVGYDAFAGRIVSALDGRKRITIEGAIVQQLGDASTTGVGVVRRSSVLSGSRNSVTLKTAEQVLDAYQSRHNGVPGNDGWAHAYDATVALLAAIDETSQLIDGSLHIDRAAVIEALSRETFYQGIVGPYGCDQFGDCGPQNLGVVVNDATDPTSYSTLVFEMSVFEMSPSEEP